MKEIVDELEDIGFLYEAWPHMESLEVETGLTVASAEGRGLDITARANRLTDMESN
ncbi:MAG: hypothetical protein MJZ62_00245 [Bacteroidales bacterium]|nr:hypothetical protein [Bacteroidales bacterium]